MQRTAQYLTHAQPTAAACDGQPVAFDGSLGVKMGPGEMRGGDQMKVGAHENPHLVHHTPIRALVCAVRRDLRLMLGRAAECEKRGRPSPTPVRGAASANSSVLSTRHRPLRPLGGRLESSRVVLPAMPARELEAAAASQDGLPQECLNACPFMCASRASLFRPLTRRRVPYRPAWKFGTLDRSLARRSFTCGKFLGRLQFNTTQIHTAKIIFNQPEHGLFASNLSLLRPRQCSMQ